MTISIVAGGWSFRNISPTKLKGQIIAVNDAAIHLPEVHTVISMDRLWVEYRWDKLLAFDQWTWLRDSACKNVWDRGGSTWRKLTRFKGNDKKHVFSTSIDTLHGSNSGACALNLVYHLKPDHLWMFGFDMGRSPEGEPYWYDPYPWSPKGATKEGKYKEWAKQMELMIAQLIEVGIKVTVVSDSRWSKSIPLISTKEFNHA